MVKRVVAEKRTIANRLPAIQGLVLSSACVLLNGNVFLWDVPPVSQDGKWEGWGKQHFQIFDVVVPKPGIRRFLEL